MIWNTKRKPREGGWGSKNIALARRQFPGLSLPEAMKRMGAKSGLGRMGVKSMDDVARNITQLRNAQEPREKTALRGDPFLQQYKHVFGTNLGPSATELAVVRGRNAIDAAKQRMVGRREIAAAAHPEGSAERYVLQAGWDPLAVNSPRFGQHLERALGAPPPMPMAKAALDLQFDSQQQAQDHLKHRAIGGGVGTVAGGALGGMLGGKRFGLPGAAVGAGLGALLGGAPGKLVADLAHDVPQRTRASYEGPMARMDAAGGFQTRIGAALPTATEFAEFAQADNSHKDTEPHTTGFEQDALERLKNIGMGHSASLEGGDDATRNEVIGIGQYDGV